MRAGPNAEPDRFARGVIAGWLSVIALAVVVRVAEWIRTTAVAQSLSAWLKSPLAVTRGEVLYGVGMVLLIAAMVFLVQVAMTHFRGGRA